MRHRRLAWRYMCSCKERGTDFSAHEVAEAVETHTRSITMFISQLNKLHRLELTREGRSAVTHRWRLLDNSDLPLYQPKKHRRPKASQRIWNSCRILRKFSAAEVEITAEVAESTVRRYLNALVRARILRRFFHEELGEMLRLNIDLGVKPPQLRPDGIYAPSRNQFFPYREVEQ